MEQSGRTELAVRLLEVQNGKCFICDKLIDLGIHKCEIDHIIPRARGGKDDENNYVLTHELCNRRKLDSDLRVARCLAKYEEIKEKHLDEGPNRPNLGDFLTEYGGAKHPIRTKIGSEDVEVLLPQDAVDSMRLPLQLDKLSGSKSFFIELPLKYLFHDTRINPRAVGPRVRGLVEEFLSGRPQLHVSLGWIDVSNRDTQVHIFDGQHKAAAQILLGVRSLPVRVFVNPDIDKLLETNTRAGTILRQVAFDKAVQRYLGSQIYWEKIEAFRQATSRQAEDMSFSEKDLVSFFRGEHREMKRYILDDVRTSVVYNPDNRLRDYLEFGGRATEKPLSYNAIEKTFFSFFIHKEPLSTRMDYKLEIGENARELEKQQLIHLMSIFAQEIFAGQYDFDRGTYRIEESIRKGVDVPDYHLRATRMAREEILYNILRYVRDCAKRFFLMHSGKPVEEEDIFQQLFPEQLWGHLRKAIRGMAALPIWVNKDPTISSSLFGGKQTYDYWKNIFSSGTTPGGVRVLAKGVTLDDLLAQ